MKYDDYIRENDAFIFELDNVLYPGKDYLLQVYYLFAQFMEYTEQLDGAAITLFMRDVYEREGEVAIFFKTATHFNIDEKYKVNFDLLHQNARLPLKLLLFAPVLDFLQQLIAAGKQLFLLTGGDPVQQLNKIRQVEWNGIGEHLILYFTDEIAKGSVPDAVDIILNRHSLTAAKVAFVANSNEEQKKAFSNMLNFVDIDKLLLP